MTPHETALNKLREEMQKQADLRHQKNEAFGETLKALFDQYRVPGIVSQEVGRARTIAVATARNGGYAKAFYPTEAGKAWRIPADQLAAIHTLIYG